MNIEPNNLGQLQRVINQAKKIIIITGKNPTIDRLAAMLAFSKVLQKEGKSTITVCPDPVSFAKGSLQNTESIVNALDGDKNFVISLDYKEGSIEKVSYNIQGDKFNLVIEPRAGFSFSKDSVSISNNNIGDASLIIFVGVSNLSDLGKIQQQVDKLLQGRDLVNIDTNNINSHYATINFVYPEMCSVSEIIVSLMKEMNISFERDAASMLLHGISSATNNFTSQKTTPDSFEAASMLMRAGAKLAPNRLGTFKQKQKISGVAKKTVNLPSFQKPTGFSSRQQNTGMKSLPQVKKTTSVFSAQTHQSQQTPKQTKPEKNISGKGETPPDWLKPKIFTSSDKTPNT